MVDDLFDVVRRPGDGDDGLGEVVLRLSVQPGAGRAAVVGRHGDALRVRVAPPPVDGRANEAVLALVADLFGVPAAAVELTAGTRSRAKRVRVRDVDPAEVGRRLDGALEAAARRPGAGRAGRVGG